MAGQAKKRGVLYVVWNKAKEKEFDRALKRSMQSLFRHHPELGLKVHEAPADANLLEKSRMYSLSPFEETLYLDIDTVVLGRLDYGFEQAQRHGVAVAICEAPYARRYAAMLSGDVVEYNTGVLFFRKEPRTAALFAEWERLAFTENSANLYIAPTGEVKQQVCNDQASFAKAVDALRFNPFVLPCNWNFRAYYVKDFYGPLKVWHDYGDPPAALVRHFEAMKPGDTMSFASVHSRPAG